MTAYDDTLQCHTQTMKEPRSIRLSKDQLSKLAKIARKIAPKGTTPTPAMAVRWLIEKETI